MRLPYPTPILQQLQSFLLNPAALLLRFRAMQLCSCCGNTLSEAGSLTAGGLHSIWKKYIQKGVIFPHTPQKSGLLRYPAGLQAPQKRTIAALTNMAYCPPTNTSFGIYCYQDYWCYNLHFSIYMHLVPKPKTPQVFHHFNGIY